MIKRIWRYVRDHWRGTHGLIWSFWINFVLLRVLVFLLQDWFSPEVGQDFAEYWILILALALLFHGIFFAWQAVGVIRATEGHIRSTGSMAPVWGAQLGLIVAFFWILSYAHHAWLITVPIPQSFTTQYEAERQSKYSITPTSDGRSLKLTGSVELGATRALEEKLATHPNITQIILESDGGNIYAARGLANIISKRGLNTLVRTECSSACTMVYMSGISRKFTENAKLGFHQYRINANYTVLNANPSLEQNKDRATLVRYGIEPWFIDKMFNSSADEMWYPEFSELVRANVITELVR